MKLSIFGAGYVGLVTATCFAEQGHDVICRDIDLQKIETLKLGRLPIYEPGLETLLPSVLASRHLQLTTDFHLAHENAEVIFITVGTSLTVDGSTDLGAVFDIAQNLAQNIKTPKAIVIKSTVPVGTTEKIQHLVSQQLQKRGLSFDCPVVFNPEFLREGSAVEDCRHPSRIVIGAGSEKAFQVMRDLYRPLITKACPLFEMDPAAAEMTKYAANAMLATRISFMNELSALCERLDVDIDLVRKGMASDPRIGSAFLSAGVGYGGSCLPKDVRALIKMAEQNHVNFGILQAVDTANQKQQQSFADKVIQFLKKNGKSKIAIWGLSFKPGTDDVREAPALHLIRTLLQEKIQVAVYDPAAIQTAKFALGPEAKQIQFFSEAYQCLQNCDALCVMTEWPEFLTADFMKMKTLMASPVIFDARNIYAPKAMKDLGFHLISVGRGRAKDFV